MTFKLFAKFRLVARYVVAVFLAAVSCFSAVAEIECFAGDPYQGPDGQWLVQVRCIGDFNSTSVVPIDDPTFGGGSCTNCTAMSPAECISHKSALISQADRVLEYIDQAKELNDIVNGEAAGCLTRINSIVEEGDEFVFLTGPDLSGYSDVDKNATLLSDYSTAAYSPNYTYPSATTRNKLNSNLGSNNGIYNYYNSIKPMLADVSVDLERQIESTDQIRNLLQSQEDDLNSLKDYVSNIDCSACSVSSGGGGGGGSTPSSGCPCSEILNAIKMILSDIKDSVDNIKDDVSKIRQKVDKWDSYIKVIRDAVAPIGTNFVYAVQYKDLDGVSFQMKQLDKLLHNQPNKPNEFDFSAFKNYSWFTRVEYLLMSIAGVYSVTNRDDDLTQTVINETYSDIADKSSTLDTKVQSIKSKVTSLHTAFKGLFNALKSSVSTHDGSGTVTLSASWFDGRGLIFTLPSGVTGSLRTITSLLWTIIFVVVMDQFLLYAWISFSYVYRFCVRQMTDFVK